MSIDIDRQQIKLFLAGWPPSVNDLTAVVHGRKIKTKRGRLFSENVCRQIDELRGVVSIPFFTGSVRVRLVFFPPDIRVRDVDNPIKATLDAMTESKLWNDDSQVKEVFAEWGDKIRGGAFQVEIEGIDGKQCREVPPGTPPMVA